MYLKCVPELFQNHKRNFSFWLRLRGNYSLWAWLTFSPRIWRLLSCASKFYLWNMDDWSLFWWLFVPICLCSHTVMVRVRSLGVGDRLGSCSGIRLNKEALYFSVFVKWKKKKTWISHSKLYVCLHLVFENKRYWNSVGVTKSCMLFWLGEFPYKICDTQ